MRCPNYLKSATLSTQVKQRLSGKVIGGMEVVQPKCLNIPVDDFRAALTGAQTWRCCQPRQMDRDRNHPRLAADQPGHGRGSPADHRPTSCPEKRRMVFDFSDATCLSINFWWFGYAHFVSERTVRSHTQVGKLGPNAIEV